MIKYNNVVQYLEQAVPEFAISDFLKDSPTLVFSSIASFVVESISQNNNQIVSRIAKFIDIVALSDEPSLNSLIDELAITLYDTSKPHYSIFIDYVSSNSRRKFQDCIDLWKQQFKA